MNPSAALPTFVITLREGVEAALVVGIVLACLQKAQKPQLSRWVYLGIFVGVIGSLLIGLLLGWALQQANYLSPQAAPIIQPVLETILCGIAITMLSWMLIWMTQQARSLKGELEGSVTATLQQSEQAAGWGVFLLISIAVLREGFETVIFILANLQQSASASIGALCGLAGAVGIGIALFKWGVKIDLRRFFQIMGIFLLLIVAGLVISTCRNIDAAVYAFGQVQELTGTLCFSTESCVLGPLVWDATDVLPDSQFPGVILKSLLGYRDHLYWVQAISYSLFLFLVGNLYFRSLRSQPIEPEKSLARSQSN
ncbi:MAG: FTR1 family protein [Leptolyngbyaceae cyanobacterium MO_188.B28]|nr:FTR1 family protein [Leptolyngbyaceae cyanobacterium MO_188.B28]